MQRNKTREGTSSRLGDLTGINVTQHSVRLPLLRFVPLQIAEPPVVIQVSSLTNLKSRIPSLPVLFDDAHVTTSLILDSQIANPELDKHLVNQL